MPDTPLTLVRKKIKADTCWLSRDAFGSFPCRTDDYEPDICRQARVRSECCGRNSFSFSFVLWLSLCWWSSERFCPEAWSRRNRGFYLRQCRRPQGIHPPMNPRPRRPRVWCRAEFRWHKILCGFGSLGHTWLNTALHKVELLIQTNQPLKALGVTLSFWGIRQLGSAFNFLWWFKLAHIYIQVTSLHKGGVLNPPEKLFNRKSISRTTTHLQSYTPIRTDQWLIL